MTSPQLQQGFVPTQIPNLAVLLHKRSDSAMFSSTSSADSMCGDSDMTDADADADEQEARGKPAPKLHRAGSTRRISMAGGERRPLERRYSVGEKPPLRILRYSGQGQQAAATADASTDQQSVVQQSGSGGAEGLMELIQSKGVLKRLSRGSLLPSPTSSFFAAAKEDTAGQQHEEMMERFQVRRIQHTPSSGSIGKDGSHSLNATPRPHSFLSRTPLQVTVKTKEPSKHTPPGSESGMQQQQQLPQVPALVIKPRSSIHKSHDGIAKAATASHGARGRFSLHRSVVRWKRKVRRSFRHFVKHISIPVSPYSAAARVQSFTLLLAFFVHAIYFPVGMAFSHGSRWHWSHYIDFATEFIFLFDFVLTFNTSFLDKRGALVTSRREIAWNYIRGWCLPELLAATPTETTLFLQDKHDGEWSHVLFDGIFRTQRLMHVPLEDDDERVTQTSMTAAEQYASNFCDALQLLQGQGLMTTTIEQSVFASFSVLLGSLVLAIVFGEVAVLVSNFNANSASYQRKMEAVFAVMGKLQLPVLLRERTHQYYEYLWREYESLDGEIVKFSRDLTHNLALEVVLFKYVDLVINVPFWRDYTPDFQKQIVLSLQVRVHLPDDFILRRGEVSDEFYMINRGSCELSTGADSFEQATAPLNPRFRSDATRQSANASRYANSAYYGQAKNEPPQDDGETEFGKRSRFQTERTSDHDGESTKRKKTSKYTRLLTRGQAFGEIALLMNYQRTANVRAVTYVEMCVLSHADFQTILTRYPDDRKHVLSNILTTCMESNEARQVYYPLKEIVKLVFADGNTLVADQITARYAASIVSAVVNSDCEDDNMKFGIGINLKNELIKLKEQDEAPHQAGDDGFSPTQSPSRLMESSSNRTESSESEIGISSARESEQNRSPELETRVQKIESTQMQTLLLLQEMRVAMDELRQPSVPVQSTLERSKERSQSPMSLRPKARGDQAIPSVKSGSDEGGNGSGIRASKDVSVTVGSRSFPFMRKRSSTAPSLHELSQALAREMAVVEPGKDAATAIVASTDAPAAANKRPRTGQQSPHGGGKLASARSATRRRSVTLRDLTEEQKTELSSDKTTPPPLLTANQRARASFRLRKTSQQDVRPAKPKERRSGSSLTKRLLIQHIGSLVSFMSTPQPSPTCYADQLFYARAPPAGGLEKSSSTTEGVHEWQTHGWT